MITTSQIIEAIEALVLDGAPELAAIYRDAVPKGFLRPSLLIALISTATTDAAHSLVHVSEFVTLVVYGAVDGFGNTDSAELLALRRRVQELFQRGFLRVGERALGVQVSTGGFEWDRAWLDLQLEYHDSRGEGADATPPMESIQTVIYNSKE